MNPTIYYTAQDLQVGDLLNKYDVHISSVERIKLRKRAEQYLKDAKMWDTLFTVNFKLCKLVLCGPDEVGHLYPYLL